MSNIQQSAIRTTDYQIAPWELPEDVTGAEFAQPQQPAPVALPPAAAVIPGPGPPGPGGAGGAGGAGGVGGGGGGGGGGGIIGGALNAVGGAVGRGAGVLGGYVASGA